MPSWKRDAVSGLIILVPILTTVWVANWLYNKLTALPLLGERSWGAMIGSEHPIAELIGVIFTLLVFVVIVFVIGSLMRTAVGRLIETWIDDVINRVPGLRIVYNASKAAMQTAVMDNLHRQTPVKLELWANMRLTAFKTGKQTADGREIVFVPTSPNVTSGFLLDVASEELIETDESVEQALARVLSAGFGGETENWGPAGAVDRSSE